MAYVLICVFPFLVMLVFLEFIHYRGAAALSLLFLGLAYIFLRTRYFRASCQVSSLLNLSFVLKTTASLQEAGLLTYSPVELVLACHANVSTDLLATSPLLMIQALVVTTALSQYYKHDLKRAHFLMSKYVSQKVSLRSFVRRESKSSFSMPFLLLIFHTQSMPL